MPKNKKILIAGGDPGGFFQPSCRTWGLKFDYFVCLTQNINIYINYLICLILLLFCFITQNIHIYIMLL